MKLLPGDPRLDQIPEAFSTAWPSLDTLLDEKVQELISARIGERSILQGVLKSNWEALQLVLKNKATVVGDFLTTQLNKAAFFRPGPAGKELMGVLSKVEWGGVFTDPQQAVQAMQQVLVPTAMTALTGVPLAGQLAAAYFAAGDKLVSMYNARISKQVVQLPWAQYSHNTDEFLTNTIIINGYSQEVDQTGLFTPPWDPDSPWKFGVAGNKDHPTGYVWAPWTGSDIPWRKDAVGAIPGTLWIFGQIQLTAPGTVDPALDRWVRTPKGLTNSGPGGARERLLKRPSTKTNAGSFFPSASTTCAAIWSLVGSNGSPDMYKVHVKTLLDEWKRAFESMQSSFVDLWEHPQELMQMIGAPYMSAARQLLGSAMEPWIAMRLSAQTPWVLGMPWDVPSDWALVTPALLAGGKPGDPMGRTTSMWIEEDLPHNMKRGPRDGRANLGELLFPGWPYGTNPKQHRCARQNACSADLAATVNAETIIHPASYLTANGPAPKGYRKMPWPPPEVDAALYASPYEAIIRPTLERLRLQQERCLKQRVVCAYVRPETINSSLPQYGAFRDPQLRQLCKDVREVLLTHPIRFTVNLGDAMAIDPVFAERLKKSGLTGTPSDFGKALGKTALLADTPTPPENQPPQGGIPFGKGLSAGPRPNGGDSGFGAMMAAMLGVGGLAAGGAFLLSDKRRRR